MGEAWGHCCLWYDLLSRGLFSSRLLYTDIHVSDRCLRYTYGNRTYHVVPSIQYMVIILLILPANSDSRRIFDLKIALSNGLVDFWG